jgi:hypothetical protein
MAISERLPAPSAAARTREVSRPDGADERAAAHVAASGERAHRPVAGRGAVDRIEVPPVVDAVLASDGQPLDALVRRIMEPRLGHELGNVRIHAGGDAARAARSIQAVAFTAGSQIVVGADAPPVSTSRGRGLLAHELAHVVQAQADGPRSPLLRRAVELPAALTSIPATQRQRVVQRLDEFAGSSPVPADDAETPRRVAEYLVVVEALVGAQITALLTQLETEAPALMQAIAFGGRLFQALREFGVVDLASSVLWYLAVSVRDTLAGDFVTDPTALAIVLRTLLTLIPGIDTAADIEDIVANLVYGVMDPTEKLVSLGWWFGIALALIGLFPEFGSAVKGVAQLAVKGIGKAAGAVVDAAGPQFRRLLDQGWMALADARAGLAEVLATAGTWGSWILATFKRIVTTAIEKLTTLAATVASKALEGVLAALNQMKELADTMLAKAGEEVQRIVRQLSDELVEVGGEIAARVASKLPDDLAREATEALAKVAPSFGLRSTASMDDALLKLRAAGVDMDTAERLTKMVGDAFEKPESFAEAMRTLQKRARGLTDNEIKIERDRLTNMGLSASVSETAAAYVAAVKKQALRDRQGVVELHAVAADKVMLVRIRGGVEEPGIPITTTVEGFIPDDVFMNEVIRGGDVILDFAALKLDPVEGAHGAITHFLHDQIADVALKAGGFAGGATGYRRLLGEIHDESVKLGLIFEDPRNFPNLKFSGGTAFWLATYDTVGGLAQPENVWPELRKLLGLAAGEL